MKIESNIFQFSVKFPGVLVCFGTAAFDTDTFQCAFISLSGDNYFVCRVNRVRVMIDF